MIKRYFFIPDMHWPYADLRYWALIMKVMRWWRPHGIVILGDFLDFWAISFHSKDPARRAKGNMEDEIAEGNRRLDELDSIGAKDKQYISGNHEYRLERYIQEKCPELHKLVPSVPEALRLEKRGWKFTPYKQHTRIGKAYVTHDVGVSGKYAHYRAADNYQKNIITGHTHRAGSTISGNVAGETHFSMMCGWGGDVEAADYAQQSQKKDWVKSAGIGYFKPDGVFFGYIVPMVNYECVIDGKLFTAPFVKQTVKKHISNFEDIFKKHKK